MQIKDLILHVESLLFATHKPLDVAELTRLINSAFELVGERIESIQVEKSIEAIQEKYASDQYCFQAVHTGGGWQFLTKKEFHKTIAAMNKDKFLKRLSNAALETLSIIAYRQPVTKVEMEAIRGVSCDYALQKLIEKDLAVIIGRKEDLPGKPLLYGTSHSFMDYFGINSADELPAPEEVNIMANDIEEYIKKETEKENLPPA